MAFTEIQTLRVQSDRRSLAAKTALYGFIPGEDNSKHALEAAGFQPPHDFVMTPFDEFVLGYYADAPSKKSRFRQAKLTSHMKEYCRILGYNDFLIKPTDFPVYFSVLMGPKSCNAGEYREQPAAERLGMSKNFPELRERFNMASRLALSSSEHKPLDRAFPTYKTDFQMLVATMFLEGKTFGAMKTLLHESLNAGYSVDIMLLDLVEILDADEYVALAQAMAAQASLYRGTAAARVVKKFKEGKVFTSPIPHSFQAVYGVVCDTWRRKYLNEPEKFAPMNLFYVQQLVLNFISYGSGAANRILSQSREDGGLGLNLLGPISAQLGSFVVHTLFGLDQYKFSTLEVLENASE